MTAAPFSDPARSFLLTDAARLSGVVRSISTTDWTNDRLTTDRHVRIALVTMRDELARVTAALDEVMQ